MSLEEKGGHAFPVGYGESWVNGMTLRDYFAGQVLPVCYSSLKGPLISPEDVARMAYMLADAMLKEREK
jgi:hypothetical protein